MKGNEEKTKNLIRSRRSSYWKNGIVLHLTSICFAEKIISFSSQSVVDWLSFCTVLLYNRYSLKLICTVPRKTMVRASNITRSRVSSMKARANHFSIIKYKQNTNSYTTNRLIRLETGERGRAKEQKNLSHWTHSHKHARRSCAKSIEIQ